MRATHSHCKVEMMMMIFVDCETNELKIINKMKIVVF